MSLFPTGQSNNIYYESQPKKNYFSFEESIFYPNKIIPLLESSLENQRNFIDFILFYFDGFPEVRSIKIAKQILNILPFIIQKLDLPFSSLLIDESSLLQLFLEIFSNYQDLSNQIALIFQNIYILFEPIENKLITSPLDDWKEILYEFEIIGDDEEYINNNYLSNTQIMFIKLNNLFDNWIKYRNMGYNIEEENLYEFDECLREIQQELTVLTNKNLISNAILEYFQEIIIKIKEFRNEKFLNDYKYINEISLEDEIYNDYNNNKNYNIINNNNIQANNNIYKNNKQVIQEKLFNIKKIPLNKRTFFYKNEKILEDENEFTEYKNYYFPFTDKQVFELKRQICGFVNSKGGRIYIGITDNRIIKGIVLNNNSIELFQNLIFSCIDDFNPQILDGKIKIYYIPIKNIQTDSFINDLYIIKIIIYPGDSTFLYSMFQESFISSIRLQGQCANLTAEEIHKEILERHKNKKINKNYLINEEDFNDPEPERVEFEEQEKYYDDYLEEYNNNNNYYAYENNNYMGMNYKRNRNRNKNRKKRRKKRVGKYIIVKIWNIDEKISVNELKMIFKDSGCYLEKFFAKRNGKSKGFGYLYFTNDILANNCILNYNNKILGKKILKLKIDNLK